MEKSDKMHESLIFDSYSQVYIFIIAAGRIFSENLELELKDRFKSKKSIADGTPWKPHPSDKSIPKILLIKREKLLKLYGPTFPKIPEFHWDCLR